MFAIRAEHALAGVHQVPLPPWWYGYRQQTTLAIRLLNNLFFHECSVQFAQFLTIIHYILIQSQRENYIRRKMYKTVVQTTLFYKTPPFYHKYFR